MLGRAGHATASLASAARCTRHASCGRLGPRPVGAYATVPASFYVLPIATGPSCAQYRLQKPGLFAKPMGAIGFIRLASGRAVTVAGCTNPVAHQRIRQSAIAAGLFGSEVSLDAADRMGDVIAIAQGNLVLLDPERADKEGEMVGHHGGDSEIESSVPLLLLQR